MKIECTKREEMELRHLLSRTCEVSVTHSSNTAKSVFTILVADEEKIVLHIIGEITDHATD